MDRVRAALDRAHFVVEVARLDDLRQMNLASDPESRAYWAVEHNEKLAVLAELEAASTEVGDASWHRWRVKNPLPLPLPVPAATSPAATDPQL